MVVPDRHAARPAPPARSASRSSSCSRSPAAAGCGCATRASSRVRDVQITGVTASDGEQVKAALESAALEMTTLHVREEVAARGDREPTPRSRTLRVEHRLPAPADDPRDRAPAGRGARARKGERRIPVTGDGRRAARRDRRARPPEPRVSTAGRSGRGSPIGARCARWRSPAPRPTRCCGAPTSSRSSSRGVVVTLQNGPELVFGSDEDARAKWIAAARVLAESLGRRRDLSRPPDSRSGGRRRARTGRLRRTENPNPQPEAENSPTLNAVVETLRVLQRFLLTFAPVDIGNEMPVPCGNPRRQRAC